MKTPFGLLSLGIAACLVIGCSAPAEPLPTEPAVKEVSQSQSGSMSLAAAGTETVFKVSGMDCSSCSAEVKGLISSQDGVKDCKVEPSGVVTVVFDDEKQSKQSLVDLINNKTSYKASL